MRGSCVALGQVIWRGRFSALLLFCLVAAISSSAQTLTTLNKFRGTNGANPYAQVVQGTNGFLYGTTYYGGVDNVGTIFKMTPSGKLTTIYNFTFNGNPYAGLVQATNGNFYGTTLLGGSGGGTVFEITPNGRLTTLYRFCSEGGDRCTDGENPYAPLIQGTDSSLYGTTFGGGANNSGIIFKISPSGTFTVLHNFCSLSGCIDGQNSFGGLVQGSDGSFYGTTRLGGTRNAGTVFRVTPSGKLTTLYNFCSGLDCTDGEEPDAGLVLASDGNFYGTTSAGGTNEEKLGTVFKITPAGTFTSLYSFCSTIEFCQDGADPETPLIQATDGNLYGTTAFGGASNHGTAFEITHSGTFTTLYSFCSKATVPMATNPTRHCFRAPMETSTAPLYLAGRP